MTPRERWLAILSRQTPDRIPTDYWATGEFHQRFRADLGCTDDESLWRKLHIDRPRYFGPKAIRTHHHDDPQADLWGLRRQPVDYGTGVYQEVANAPLGHMQTVAEIHAWRWPSPDDYEYQSLADALAKDDGYRVRHSATYEPFLLYCCLRGLEQGFEDLAVNHDIADAIVGHIFDFFYEFNRRIYAAGRGRIDITYVAEDLGSQTSPLMSLATYRRFLLPNQKKMADLARSFNVHIMYHTDGNARIFLPDLVDEVGIEILNPIQWRCTDMDRAGLVRDFGGRIAFHGAMDNQYTLPFGSVEEVIQETKDNLAVFGQGRWICAPCHNIQAVSPTANIVALYETIHEIGKL